MLNRQPRAVSQTKLIWIIGLIVLSTALFVIGTTLERQSEGSEENHTREATVAQSKTVSGENAERHSESVEGSSEARENGESHPENSVSAESAAETSPSETIAGINIENPALIASAVVGWIVLAVAIFWFGYWALILIILASLAMLAFDLLEIITQINRANSGLALIAALVALSHAALALTSVLALRESRVHQTAPGLNT